MPATGSSAYQDANRVAQLVSLPYGDYARYILKVSYNIGADTSLVLFGLTQGVNDIDDALVVERDTLRDQYGIPSDEIFFIDGSGGGDTTATNEAVTKILEDMSRAPVAE
jgi:D-alanyl-D-alanine carboxypeptidase/D-alanyl-D-alanine carboxypeptidase/D-alanyl-D-alanine-endopeptidase (penicillin-binding protein 4)